MPTCAVQELLTRSLLTPESYSNLAREVVMSVVDISSVRSPVIDQEHLAQLALTLSRQLTRVTEAVAVRGGEPSAPGDQSVVGTPVAAPVRRAVRRPRLMRVMMRSPRDTWRNAPATCNATSARSTQLVAR